MILAALLAGALVGLSLGALGGGGSMLAVPVLVYLLGQSPAKATTGSLVVVAVTASVGALAAYRARNALLGRGVGFALAAMVGAAVGGKASARVAEPVLLAAFSMLMLAVGTLMAVRELRRCRADRRDGRNGPSAPSDHDVGTAPVLLALRPRWSCDCRRAFAVLVVATGVGLVTGFLGVGGGFLVVPALTLILGLPIRRAVGTSLVVIALTSVVALGVRLGAGLAPDWSVVLSFTAAAAAGGYAGARVAARADTRRLSVAFTVLVLVVALYTSARALPAML